MPGYLSTFIAVTVGLILGSFANVIAYRVPRGESILRPRSHCPHCKEDIRLVDLFPILSWFIRKGRCRHCAVSIPLRYPVIELAITGLFVATNWTISSVWQQMAWDFLWMLLITLMGTDLTSMRVPNVLSLPGSIISVVLAASSGIHTPLVVVVGAFTGFFAVFLLHLGSGGKMGLGDAKLYLSIGAYLGPLGSLESLILAAIFASVIGIFMRVLGLIQRGQYIAFVPYIVIGVILVAFYGQSIAKGYIHFILQTTR